MVRRGEQGQAFARALRGEMQRAGSNPKKLVHQARLGKSSLYAYLNGTTVCPHDVLHTIADALGTPGPIRRALGSLRDLAEEERRQEREAVEEAARTLSSSRPKGSSVSNVARPLVETLLGREALLRKLVARLDGSRSRDHKGKVALVGMAGVGKSEIALHLATAASRSHSVVWWARAESAVSLATDLADLASALSIVSDETPSTLDHARKLAIQWLSENEGWFLVLDNVDDIHGIQELLPVLGKGTVLITTRRRRAWRQVDVESVNVGPLPRTASVQLLRQIVLDPAFTGTDDVPSFGFDDVSADRLADALGDLPLALHHAAAHMAMSRVDSDTYLAALLDSPEEVLDGAGDDEPGTTAIARTWAVTLGALQEVSPAAVDVLQALSWLASERLPRSAVRLGAANAQPAPPDIALGLLSSYHLVDVAPDAVSMHRVLQHVLRASQRRARANRDAHGEAAPAGQLLAVRWLISAAPQDPLRNEGGWPMWRLLTPHVLQLAKHMGTDLTGDAVDLFSYTGAFLAEQGRHVDSLRLQEQVLAACRRVLPPGDERTIAAANALANGLWFVGRYEESLPLRIEAVESTVKLFSENHAVTGNRLDNLAATLGALGRYDEALPLRFRALRATEAAETATDVDIATRLNNTANTLHHLGRFAEAVPLRQRAIDLIQSALGDDHHETGMQIGNLATELNELGRFEEAVALHQRSLAITRSALGDEHPDTATRLGNLGNALRGVGRLEEALQAHREAYRINLAALTPDHPELAIDMDHLGTTLRALGQLEEALGLHERAAQLTELDQGPAHSETAHRLSTLAATVSEMGDWDRAARLQERALDIFRTVTVVSPERVHLAQEELDRYRRRGQR